MDWRRHISNLTSSAKFGAPADRAMLQEAEEVLNVHFPDELRSLLSESDGVEGEYGLGLIWPIRQIMADNTTFRTQSEFPDLYMPFDSSLFFGDAGNGDQFFFPVLRGGVPRQDVFAWNHENDSRVWVAPSLAVYLEWWLKGTIEL